MKSTKNHILTAFLVALQLTSVCFCQSIVTFDNSTNSVTYDKWVKEGSTVSLKITSINPFAVNSTMSIEVASSSHDDGVDVFKKVFNTPTLSNNSAPNEASLYGTTTAERVEAFNFIKDFTNVPSQVVTLIENQDDLIKILYADFLVADKARLEIQRIIYLDTLLATLMENTDINSLAKFDLFIENYYGIEIATAFQIHELFQQYLADLKKALVNANLDIDLLKQIQTLKSQELLKQPSSIQFSSDLDSLSKYVQNLDKLYAGENLEKLQKKIFNIQNNFLKIKFSGFTLYGDKVVTLSSDIIKIGDTIKLKNGEIFKSISPVTIRSYGGCRINFSAGFAGTKGDINGKSFFLLRDSAQNVYGIDSSSVNKLYDFSPVALLNVTFPIKAFITPGFSFGLNPDLSALDESRFLFGGTISFNASNNLVSRFLITAGGTLGLADQLMPKYLNVSDFNSLNSLSDNQITEKALRMGGFIAFTFNIGN